VHELHRERDVRRGRSRVPIPTWDELDESTRSQLIVSYRNARAQYDAGQRDPSEVKLDG
jgi:hypothetical protein